MYFLKVLATHLWSHVEPVYFFYFKVLIGRTKSVLSSTTDRSFKFFPLLINQALHFLKLVQFTPPVVHFGLSTKFDRFTGICCEHLGWTIQTCSLPNQANCIGLSNHSWKPGVYPGWLASRSSQTSLRAAKLESNSSVDLASMRPSKYTLPLLAPKMSSRV